MRLARRAGGRAPRLRGCLHRNHSPQPTDPPHRPRRLPPRARPPLSLRPLLRTYGSHADALRRLPHSPRPRQVASPPSFVAASGSLADRTPQSLPRRLVALTVPFRRLQHLREGESRSRKRRPTPAPPPSARPWLMARHTACNDRPRRKRPSRKRMHPLIVPGTVSVASVVSVSRFPRAKTPAGERSSRPKPKAECQAIP